MPDNQIVETELRKLIESVDGDYVAIYDKLVKKIDEMAIVELTPTNVDARKESWRKALAKKDKGPLRKAYETMRSYVALARQNAAIIESEPSELTAPQAASLMKQFISLKSLETIAKADRDAIKRRVMAAMTEMKAAEGEQFPENVNATIDVPEEGHRFFRYGTGRQDPELDEEHLRQLLGPEVWERVTRLEVIPEQKIRTLDYGLLIQAAQADPKLGVLEKVRDALIVGGWKSPSFTIQEL